MVEARDQEPRRDLAVGVGDDLADLGPLQARGVEAHADPLASAEPRDEVLLGVRGDQLVAGPGRRRRPERDAALVEPVAGGIART